MEQTTHKSAFSLICPQCDKQWYPLEDFDDSSFYIQETSEHSTGTLSSGIVQEGTVIPLNRGHAVITGFCSPACQCDWLKLHGGDQLRKFTPMEAARILEWGALCHECGEDSYQQSEDGAPLFLGDEMGNPLIRESDTHYFIANGFYGSPVDGGASFCDRQGVECILKYFEKQKGPST